MADWNRAEAACAIGRIGRPNGVCHLRVDPRRNSPRLATGDRRQGARVTVDLGDTVDRDADVEAFGADLAAGGHGGEVVKDHSTGPPV